MVLRSQFVFQYPIDTATYPRRLCGDTFFDTSPVKSLIKLESSITSTKFSNSGGSRVDGSTGGELGCMDLHLCQNLSHCLAFL